MEKKYEEEISIITTSLLLITIISIIFIYFFDLNKYGISFLCSSIGGIWCYWPPWREVVKLITLILTFVLIFLLIIYLKKLLNNKFKSK